MLNVFDQLGTFNTDALIFFWLVLVLPTPPSNRLSTELPFRLAPSR
jgi:hypothetical protein